MEINLDLKSFTNFQNSLTEENAEEKLANVEFPFDTILPIQIGGVQCERPTWNDFKGTPDPKNEYFLAYIYWAINYFYDTSKTFCEVEKVMKFTVTSLTAQPKIKQHSWCRYKTKDLLHHETGHYVIACLCALEFKKRVMERNAQTYSTSHAKEITQIFNATMKEFCALERVYDNETCHYLNEEKQKEWNLSLVQKMLAYKKYFAPAETVPDSKIILAQIQGNSTKQIQKKTIQRDQVTVQKRSTSNTDTLNKNQTLDQKTTQIAQIPDKIVQNAVNQGVLNQHRALRPTKLTQNQLSYSQNRVKLHIKNFNSSSIPTVVSNNVQSIQKQSQIQNDALSKPSSRSNVSTSTSLATTATTFKDFKQKIIFPHSKSNKNLILPPINNNQNKSKPFSDANIFNVVNLTLSPQ